MGGGLSPVIYRPHCASVSLKKVSIERSLWTSTTRQHLKPITFIALIRWWLF